MPVKGWLSPSRSLGPSVRARSLRAAGPRLPWPRCAAPLRTHFFMMSISWHQRSLFLTLSSSRQDLMATRAPESCGTQRRQPPQPSPPPAPALPAPPPPHLVLVEADVTEAAGAQAVTHLPGPAASRRLPPQRRPAGGPLRAAGPGGGYGGAAPLHRAAATRRRPVPSTLLPRHRPPPPRPVAVQRRRQARKAKSKGWKSRRKARACAASSARPAAHRRQSARCGSASSASLASTALQRAQPASGVTSGVTPAPRAGSGRERRRDGGKKAPTCRSGAGSGRGCGGRASPPCPAPRRSMASPAAPPAGGQGVWVLLPPTLRPPVASPAAVSSCFPTGEAALPRGNAGKTNQPTPQPPPPPPRQTPRCLPG